MNEYDSFASIYDSQYAELTKDVPFYLELARQTGSPVLELACGTGRILLPLARAGIEVTGLDSSQKMLESLQNKLDREEPGVRTRVGLVNADMREFALDTRYKFVFCAFHSFQHLMTTEDQLACLKSVRTCLAEDGLLCLDVFAPRHDMLAQKRQEHELSVRVDPSTGRETVSRYVTERDQVNQAMKSTLVFDRIGPDGTIHRSIHRISLCWIFHREMHLLLRLAGFEVVQVYGDYDKRPYDYVSGEQVFVVKRGKDAQD